MTSTPLPEQGTDTNQASEDKPTNQHLVCLWRLQDIEETIADASPEELVDLHPKLVALSTDITEAVQSAIRTEKLKLLAEVRERVVGNIVCTCGCNFRDGCLCLDKSELRTEQYDLLSKLEAEL